MGPGQAEVWKFKQATHMGGRIPGTGPPSAIFPGAFTENRIKEEHLVYNPVLMRMQA